MFLRFVIVTGAAVAVRVVH